MDVPRVSFVLDMNNVKKLVANAFEVKSTNDDCKTTGKREMTNPPEHVLGVNLFEKEVQRKKELE